jgi:hypothetical protein
MIGLQKLKEQCEHIVSHANYKAKYYPDDVIPIIEGFLHLYEIVNSELPRLKEEHLAYVRRNQSQLAKAEEILRGLPQLALEHGYALDHEPKHQPWANEANVWLRSQNAEIKRKLQERVDRYFIEGEGWKKVTA